MEDIPSYKRLPKDCNDSDIHIQDSLSVTTNDFRNEKHLTQFIDENIKRVVKTVFGYTYISHKTEAEIGIIQKRKGGIRPRGRRVDFLIKCSEKTLLVETKCPFYLRENTAAIGQLLDYGREFLDPKKELILLTTKFCPSTAKTIEFYNLPIRYIFMDMSKSLEFKKSK